ncbi:MAG: hypothetical protein QF903_09710 [Planctomycetota bacterium]|nr:hypothetical protein [Planctomycetota bacterium]MDP6762334.1 hypothetical protein [Planctomycetota bacterium]MDP6989741.1 hypothetical protein [Planctomycetota bacterium]
MKSVLPLVCLTFAACLAPSGPPADSAPPPEPAADAPAAEVYDAWRAFALRTDRRLLLHIGAPW